MTFLVPASRKCLTEFNAWEYDNQPVQVSEGGNCASYSGKYSTQYLYILLAESSLFVLKFFEVNITHLSIKSW